MRLHRWLPGILGLFLVLNVGARFVSLDYFAFRGWEVMLLGAGPTGPFAPSRQFVNPWSYGDLPNLVGRPDLRQVRAERFTTDAYGFRNPPQLQEQHLPVAGLINGDSFAVGCGLPDQDTLAAQLGARLGQPVYSIAGKAPAAAPDIIATANRLNLSRRLVIQVYIDRWGLPAPGVDPPLYTTERPGPLPAGQRLARWWDDVKVSRLQILINRNLKNWWEPPVPEGGALVRHFLNDREVLRLPKDVESSYAAMRGYPYFPWLHKQMAGEKIDLLVVLVPNKYTVYEPLLKEADPRRGQPGWMDQLSDYLTKEGVPFVNLTPLFRQRAAEEFTRGKLLYWLDDSHWNAEGVRLAAETIAEKLGRRKSEMSRPSPSPN